jgi:hypothetical protein
MTALAQTLHRPQDGGASTVKARLGGLMRHRLTFAIILTGSVLTASACGGMNPQAGIVRA